MSAEAKRTEALADAEARAKGELDSQSDRGGRGETKGRRRGQGKCSNGSRYLDRSGNRSDKNPGRTYQ